MSKDNFRKKSKSRREMSNKDHEIYMALTNPSHTTSIVNENGTKEWVTAYKFISLLHQSIKKREKYLSAEKAEEVIMFYEMPAIQRCLQLALLLNRSQAFNENDLHKYIVRKFEHITLEMLEKDYQTEEASKFKERYEKSLDLESK